VCQYFTATTGGCGVRVDIKQVFYDDPSSYMLVGTSPIDEFITPIFTHSPLIVVVRDFNSLCTIRPGCGAVRLAVSAMALVGCVG
jgi:hypothetical protein